MKRFRAMNKLKEVSLKVIAENFSQEVIMRFIWAAAKDQVAMNQVNTTFDAKHLIGWISKGKRMRLDELTPPKGWPSSIEKQNSGLMSSAHSSQGGLGSSNFQNKNVDGQASVSSQGLHGKGAFSRPDPQTFTQDGPAVARIHTLEKKLKEQRKQPSWEVAVGVLLTFLSTPLPTVSTAVLRKKIFFFSKHKIEVLCTKPEALCGVLFSFITDSRPKVRMRSHVCPHNDLQSFKRLDEAAVMATHRKSVEAETYMVDSFETLPMSMFWLGFQYMLFGATDLFIIVGLLQFFYLESLDGMKSLSTAISCFSHALQFYLSSIVVEMANTAITLKRYPAYLVVTTIICFVGSFQSLALIFGMEHKLSVWSIGWDMNLLVAAGDKVKTDRSLSLLQPIHYFISTRPRGRVLFKQGSLM